MSLPVYPWNDLINMTDGGSEARAIIVALAAVHEAINENTKVLQDLVRLKRATG